MLTPFPSRDKLLWVFVLTAFKLWLVPKSLTVFAEILFESAALTAETVKKTQIKKVNTNIIFLLIFLPPLHLFYLKKIIFLKYQK